MTAFKPLTNIINFAADCVGENLKVPTKRVVVDTVFRGAQKKLQIGTPTIYYWIRSDQAIPIVSMTTHDLTQLICAAPPPP